MTHGPRYPSGPAAATEPRRVALERVTAARRILLVEGVSDQIAVETLAARMGRDLDDEGVVVAPMGGAHAIATFLDVIARRTDQPRCVGGLCDSNEEPVFRRALGAGPNGLEQLGFFVCEPDLEAELVRAVGWERVERLLDDHGELRAFRTMQKQSAWRARAPEDQIHRFLRSRARRMHHYAKALVEAADGDRLPRPLLGVLDGPAPPDRP